MNLHEYLMHLERFHKVNFPDAPENNLPAIVSKLHEECGEVLGAYSEYGKSRELLQEFADCLNVAIWGIVKCGGINPLWEAYLKLEKTSAKYAAMKEK